MLGPFILNLCGYVTCCCHSSFLHPIGYHRPSPGTMFLKNSWTHVNVLNILCQCFLKHPRKFTSIVINAKPLWKIFGCCLVPQHTSMPRLLYCSPEHWELWLKPCITLLQADPDPWEAHRDIWEREEVANEESSLRHRQQNFQVTSCKTKVTGEN